MSVRTDASGVLADIVMWFVRLISLMSPPTRLGYRRCRIPHM